MAAFKSLLSSDDGLRHIQGCGLNTFETLCGACDTGATYEESDEPPNCYPCLKAAELVFQSITGRQVAEALAAQRATHQGDQP